MCVFLPPHLHSLGGPRPPFPLPSAAPAFRSDDTSANTLRDSSYGYHRAITVTFVRGADSEPTRSRLRGRNGATKRSLLLTVSGNRCSCLEKSHALQRRARAPATRRRAICIWEEGSERARFVASGMNERSERRSRDICC